MRKLPLKISTITQVEIVKAGAIPVLSTLRNSSCAMERGEADMALKRLMAVASTRDAIATWEASQLNVNKHTDARVQAEL